MEARASKSSPLDFPAATKELERQTEAKLSTFLSENNYKRQYGPGVCEKITDLRSLSVWVIQNKHWYVLKSDAIQYLIKLGDESGRSLCNLLMLDFFSIQPADYAKLKTRFALPNDRVGIFDDANGNYVMILELPDTNRFEYNPTVVGLAASGLLVTAASLFAGYKASKSRARASNDDSVPETPIAAVREAAEIKQNAPGWTPPPGWIRDDLIWRPPPPSSPPPTIIQSTEHFTELMNARKRGQ